MNNEIKEILDELQRRNDRYNYCLKENISYSDDDYNSHLLLDCITNLQEELEDLRESDWAWHQTLKAENKREYRSKFLKEFQQEYNTNTFPDYDEIYKRYDKLKKENKRLNNIIDELKQKNNLAENILYDYLYNDDKITKEKYEQFKGLKEGK